MRSVRLLSVAFALSAAILAVAAVPSHRAQLRADDDAECNGTGKNCQHSFNCTQMCAANCCGYSEAWSYYPGAT